MGWIGERDELFDSLQKIGAERTEQGEYLLRGGKGPVSFMGAGDEFVLDDELECRIGGKWKKLVPLLTGGLRVMVF